MRISTKGRYGLRIMLELAGYYGKNLLTVRAISNSQDISEKYIEQIISILNKAKLVKSQRGANGGYALTRAPEEITVGEILRATEGGLSVVACSERPSSCERSPTCLSSPVWVEIQRAIESVADNTSLAQLIGNKQ